MSIEINQKFPLSHNQKSLFFMEQLIGGNPVFNLSFAVRFGPGIKLDILRESIIDLFRYNDTLKTVFETEHSGVVQIIKKNIAFSIPVFNMEGISEAEIIRMIEDEKDKPFDLSKGPLVRVALYQSVSGCILFIVMHHIISDFWTYSVLLQELSYVYSQKVNGSDDYKNRIMSKPSYEIFVRHQEELLARKTELADYWKSVLSGELPVLNIQTDRPRPPVQSWNGGCVQWTLSREDSGRITRLCKQRGIGKHVFLLSVFQLLLHKYTGQNDILIGALTTGRTNLRFSRTVGYFVNPVVTRCDLSEDLKFSSFLERSKQAVLDAFAHKEYPFELIVQQCNPQRDLSRSPVFQAMYTYQTLPRFAGFDISAISAAALNRSAAFDFNGIAMEYIPLARRTAQYELSLIATELEEGIGLLLEYNTDLFDSETIQGMLIHYENLLRSALDGPEKCLSELDILCPDERAQALQTYNHTKMPYEPVCLHHCFEKQARLTPASKVIVFGQQSLTYMELSERTNQLANFLRGQGLEENQPVAVCVERSLDMVIALMAVLKAGAYYLPLDPSFPSKRLAMIIDDASMCGRPPLLLTQENLLGLFPNYQGVVVCFDRDRILIELEKTVCPEVAVDSGNLAYTIYTSGSTGIPKGVKITHKSLVNFLQSMRVKPGITSDDILLAVTTVSFDIAGLELWLPLISGAVVALASDSDAKDGRILARLMEENNVTVMQATPSTWKILLASGWKGRAGMKMLCGGEAFPPTLAA